jgi:DNA polymerase III subunit epsilon
MISLDLEATGTDPQHDRITQIAIVSMEGAKILTSLVNPGQPIPDKVQEITGITNAMVATAPTFAMIARQVCDMLSGQELVGFNLTRFDIPMLAEEFERANVEFDWQSIQIIDVGTLFMILQPRTLCDAVRQYLGREHVGAHDASVDAMATAEVLLEMADRHPELLGKDAATIAAISQRGKRIADPFGKLAYDDAGRVVFNTYRNKGVPIGDDLGYANWMLRTDFPRSTRKFLMRELDRIQVDHRHESSAEQQQEIPF